MILRLLRAQLHYPTNQKSNTTHVLYSIIIFYHIKMPFIIILIIIKGNLK